MAKLLLVEDDASISDSIESLLTFERHIVDIVNNGADAMHLLNCRRYDAIILDWQIPEISGLEVCRRFRGRGGTTPILMLTGKNSVLDKELGLDSGTDDYLTKPFHAKELLARVRALLRRGASLADNILQVGRLSLHPQKYEINIDTRSVPLSKLEFAMMELFLRYPNEVFSPEAIHERVWPADSERSPDNMRVLIKKLRDKLDQGKKPSLILNMHGVGYKLNVEELTRDK